MTRTAPALLPSSVLTKAVLRAAEALGLNQKGLGRVLGVSEATVSRLGRSKVLDPDTEEGELALLFVRLFRSLDTLVGGDAAKFGVLRQRPDAQHDLRIDKRGPHAVLALLDHHVAWQEEGERSGGASPSR